MNEWSLLPGKRYRNLEIAIHVGVWLLFFSWPFAFAHTDIPEFRRFYMRYLINPFLCLSLFYLKVSSINSIYPLVSDSRTL